MWIFIRKVGFFLCICIFYCVCIFLYICIFLFICIFFRHVCIFMAKRRLLIYMYPLQKGEATWASKDVIAREEKCIFSWIQESHQILYHKLWHPATLLMYLWRLTDNSPFQARKIVFSLVSNHGPFRLLDSFCDKIDFCLESWWWRQPDPHLKGRLYWHLL